jgi:hypothetical protein
VQKLVELKDRAWAERLIAGYVKEFSGFKEGTRVRRNVKEMVEELKKLT